MKKIIVNKNYIIFGQATKMAGKIFEIIFKKRKEKKLIKKMNYITYNQETKN
ncbi:MAG: hypothetical protein WAU24_03745 [Chitinophagaceae bacterium]